MQTFYTNVWILQLGQLLLSWKMLENLFGEHHPPRPPFNYGHDWNVKHHKNSYQHLKRELQKNCSKIAIYRTSIGIFSDDGFLLKTNSDFALSIFVGRKNFHLWFSIMKLAMHTLSAKSFLIWYISMEIFLGWYADWIMENICRLIHNTIRFFLGSKKKTRLWKGAKTCWRISKASDSIRNENFGNFFPILLRFALLFWKI